MDGALLSACTMPDICVSVEFCVATSSRSCASVRLSSALVLGLVVLVLSPPLPLSAAAGAPADECQYRGTRDPRTMLTTRRNITSARLHFGPLLRCFVSLRTRVFIAAAGRFQAVAACVSLGSALKGCLSKRDQLLQGSLDDDISPYE